MGIMSLIVPKQSEVTDINKQKFLPELGRLLTFMVEEDRQTALAMYSRLFDDAEDEQLLQNLLESPTRQAVVIARAYDAKERKKQLESPTHGEEQTPGFVLAIDRLYQQVAPRHLEMAEPEEAPAEEPAPVVNQFSLFEDDAHPIDDSEYVPFQIEADTVPIAEPVEELPVEPELNVPEEEAADANPPMRSALRTLIGIYLVYLGYSILKPVVKSEPVGMPLWVAILFGALFIVAGGCFILMQLKNFKNR